MSISERSPWKEGQLRDVVSRIIGGGTPSRLVSDYWGGTIPWATVKDFQDDTYALEDTLEHISSDGLKKSASSLIPSGIPLICVRMAVGRTAITTVPTAINQDVKALFPNELVLPKYLLFMLAHTRRHFESIAVGSTVKGINVEQLLGIRIQIPPLSEQHRIIEVIESASENTQQSEQAIAKLKQLRAGLLRDLLTRGLDDQGELRDPVTHPEQFEETLLGLLPSEWAISTAETEFDILAGFTLGEQRKPRDHRHPYLRVANVQRGYITLDDVAELEASGDELTERLLEVDDLLVVEGHASPNEIGRCARVTEECAGMTFQNHLFRLRSKRLRPDFAERWLNSEWTVMYWRRQCGTSSGLNTINQTLLRQLSVVVPSPSEQEHIAQTCIAYDAHIRAEESHYDKLRQIKQGLMADLLTGRVHI